MKHSFRQSPGPIAAAIGAAFLVAGCGAAPAPSRAPATLASPAAVEAPVRLPATGALDAGTYYMEPGPDNPARVTFTVPSGWATKEGFVFTDPAPAAANPPLFSDVMLVTWVISHIYSDVCKHGTLTALGPSVDDIASALHAQKGRTASAPTDVTLGGLPAKRIELTVPAELDVATCDGGIVRFWPGAGPNEDSGLCCARAGSTDVIYVVEAAGQPFVVVARHEADSSAADIAELDDVVASLKLDPPTRNPSPSSP